jgi:hypothetical protein
MESFGYTLLQTPLEALIISYPLPLGKVEPNPRLENPPLEKVEPKNTRLSLENAENAENVENVEKSEDLAPPFSKVEKVDNLTGKKGSPVWRALPAYAVKATIWF